MVLHRTSEWEGTLLIYQDPLVKENNLKEIFLLNKWFLLSIRQCNKGILKASWILIILDLLSQSCKILQKIQAQFIKALTWVKFPEWDLQAKTWYLEWTLSKTLTEPAMTLARELIMFIQMVKFRLNPTIIQLIFKLDKAWATLCRCNIGHPQIEHLSNLMVELLRSLLIQ